MSLSNIELVLPAGFQLDPILTAGTQEQRGFFTATAFMALNELMNKTDLLSHEERLIKATAKEAKKWMAEKNKLIEKAKKARKEHAAEVKHLKDELAKTETLLKKAKIVAATLRKSEYGTIARVRDQTRLKVESEKSHEIETHRRPGIVKTCNEEVCI